MKKIVAAGAALCLIVAVYTVFLLSKHYRFGYYEKIDENTFSLTFGKSVVSRNKAQNKETLYFKTSPAAKSIPFDKLMTFLEENKGHSRAYVVDDYDCKHFARNLFDDTQTAGIRSHFVSLQLVGKSTGHAIVGIETSDRGTVFVDFTPLLVGNVAMASKRLVWIHENDPYYSMPLAKVPKNFANTQVNFTNFYFLQKDKLKFLDQYTKELDTYNAETIKFNEAVKVFNELQPARDTASNEQYKSKYEELEREKGKLQFLENRLYQLSAFIDEQGLRTFVDSSWIIKEFALFPGF